MKGKTMMSVVVELMGRGHQIDFYVRNDGGILITRIDGNKYKGAKGNARAREMTGQKMSEARMAQLKFATGTRKELRSKKLRGVKIPDAISKEYNRVKEMWDKAFKAKNGKPHPAGYFTQARIKKSIVDYGEEEALRRIGEAERYSTGIAYSKNVEILATHIETAGIDANSRELVQLAQDIRANAYAIREEWIEPTYNKLYNLNKGADPAEVAKDIRKILRLVA